MKPSRSIAFATVLWAGVALPNSSSRVSSSSASSSHLSSGPSSVPGPLFTGSMGVKVFPSGSTVIDLATEGIYDPATYGWAVVFDWTSIDVPPDAVVTFTQHPSRAPVIWHATGDVQIDGEVLLNGQSGVAWSAPAAYAEPGPGGFRGGRSAFHALNPGSAGFGPGGGFMDESPGQGHDFGGTGSHGTAGQAVPSEGATGPTYGGAGLFPLIGGSGGAAGGHWGGFPGGGGGGGGGAFLLAAEGTVSISSSATLSCNAGAGGLGSQNGQYYKNAGGAGSGGALRVLGDAVSITGATLSARGDVGGYGRQGGAGRIRIEADSASDPSKLVVYGSVIPAASYSDQIYEVLPTTPPALRVVAYDPDGIGGPAGWVDVSRMTEPGAALWPPSAADVTGLEAGTVSLQIRGDNTPFGEIVILRLTESNGQAVQHLSGPLVATGNGLESLAEIEFTLPGGVSAIQLRVDYND